MLIWFGRIGAFMVVVALGVSAWRHRDDAWVQALWRPEAVAKPVVFDNGSVRDNAAPLAPSASAAAKGPDNLPGPMKKCVRGKQVIYTDQPCESGAKVVAVTGGNLTVVPSLTPKAPAPTSAGPTQADRSTLHQALDVHGQDNMRDKMMERAINR